VETLGYKDDPQPPTSRFTSTPTSLFPSNRIYGKVLVMHWRTKFLLQAAQVLILPPLALHACFRVLDYHPGSLLRPLLFVLSIVAYIRLNSWFRFYTIERKATALGARTIPIAKGKWPGNLDLLIRLMQTPKEAYIGARLYEFFKQYKTNTINIRPLGMDLVMTCDHGIIKEMLATGFSRWHKGPRQREKLADFFGKGIFASDGEEWKMVSYFPCKRRHTG
jgi:hypothetical protein